MYYSAHPVQFICTLLWENGHCYSNVDVEEEPIRFGKYNNTFPIYFSLSRLARRDGATKPNYYNHKNFRRLCAGHEEPELVIITL